MKDGFLRVAVRRDDLIIDCRLPPTYNETEFNALIHTPSMSAYDHIALWVTWVIEVGGDVTRRCSTGSPYPIDFDALDASNIDLKIDHHQLYDLRRAAEKRLFCFAGEWFQVLDSVAIDWTYVAWRMKEPGKALPYLMDVFRFSTKATPYKQVANEKITIRYRFDTDSRELIEL